MDEKSTLPIRKLVARVHLRIHLLQHVTQIKKALDIFGVYTEESSYIHKKSPDLPKFQIDLLIDRADNAINLCEVKYYNAEYILTSDYAKKMRNRKALFQTATKTKKQVITTLITTFGLSSYSRESAVDKELDIDDLFR